MKGKFVLDRSYPENKCQRVMDIIAWAHNPPESKPNGQHNPMCIELWFDMLLYFLINCIPIVLHKAVEVSQYIVVNHGWQSEPPDGSRGGWSVGLSICPSIYLAT